ncbi:MAG: hypothetical protein GX600_04050 [Dehalococcoidia bacterium]|nr:hypothetical protein [Dehalococcoidia bacterium]
MYWRFAAGLRGFLRQPLTLERSRTIIEQRLVTREQSFLFILSCAVYTNRESPYYKLLNAAGCDFGDVATVVESEGLEGALKKLCDAGVYMSIEEFKGKQEIVRGSTRFSFRSGAFDNPLLLRQFEGTTGGSRGVGGRTFFDFDHIAYDQAAYQMCLLDAYGLLDAPVVLWRPIAPGGGPRKVLEYVKMGKTPERWFSPIQSADIRPSVKSRLATAYIVHMSRLCGAHIPSPEYVSLDDAVRVARSIGGLIAERGSCWVNTGVSQAVRVCQAAREDGLRLDGTVFLAGGEPVTEVKRREIESSGARVCPRYVFVEAGYAGLGCLHNDTSDDVHLLKDSLALIQRRREVPHAGVSVDALLFTTLCATAPKILFNVETGDYATVERRRCGCYLEKMGLPDHLSDIRSFEKLTSHGMTFLGSNLIDVIERVLPSKYGGSSIDYQMLEEEDEAGQTHLYVLVSPDVGEIDEHGLIDTVLGKLAEGEDTHRMMTHVWLESNTVRVRRTRPVTTARGKLLPLHIQKEAGK